MTRKIRRKRVNASDLLVAIASLDSKVDARTEELKGLIDRRADEFNVKADQFNAKADQFNAKADGLMDGLRELHSFTEFSLRNLEDRLTAQMTRRFDRLDDRFEAIDRRFVRLETRVDVLESPRA